MSMGLNFKISWLKALVVSENNSCQKIQVTLSIGSYLSIKCLIFRAYMKSIEEQGPEPRLPGLTQYTPEQLFFVSFSQVSMILDFSKFSISTPPMHNEDLPTYCLSLWLQLGSNPCLWFDHFITSKISISLINRKLKSVQSKDKIQTCNLRSKCQSANHYTALWSLLYSKE